LTRRSYNYVLVLGSNYSILPRSPKNESHASQYDYNVNRITEKEKMRIARAKLKGRKPKVPAGMKNSTIPIRAVLTAMNKCYRNDARLRPTARELAAYLQSELDAIELPIKVMNRFEFDV